MFVRESNPTTIGIINIIFALIRESKTQLGNVQPSEEALIHQWLEYTLVHVANANTSQNIQIVLKVRQQVISVIKPTQSDIFQELNTILSSKTYLVGHKLTVADAFLYYVLINIMVSLGLN